MHLAVVSATAPSRLLPLCRTTAPSQRARHPYRGPSSTSTRRRPPRPTSTAARLRRYLVCTSAVSRSSAASRSAFVRRVSPRRLSSRVRRSRPSLLSVPPHLARPPLPVPVRSTGYRSSTKRTPPRRATAPRKQPSRAGWRGPLCTSSPRPLHFTGRAPSEPAPIS